MTKKDYVLIADAIAPFLSSELAPLVASLIFALSVDNPRFDSRKFIERIRKNHESRNRF